MKNYKKGTLCIQGGYEPKIGEARVLPIYQSTTYKYDDPDHLEKLFNLEAEGHLYTRISNPTVEALEKKYAELEGGVAAVATASGQAAILNAILNICKAGDNVISACTLYGGTVNLFTVHLKNMGIEVRFINPEDSEEDIIKKADENTKLIYGETIGNPSLNILDLEKFARVGKALEIPLVVDNTVATPMHCNPIEFGANVVIHSTTKYSDGHAQAIGGMVVDGGNFNWDNGKFKELVEGDPSYHGMKYVEVFKAAAYSVKLRVTLIRDLGNTLSPFNAYLTNLGLETLHLRMERHSKNALELAKWLKENPKVSFVNYPFLEGNNEYEKAQKYLKGGASGILNFGIKGGISEAKAFMKGLKLTALVVHLGDARTSILHPATTTHNQLDEKAQVESGVTKDMLRVSVGIEDIEDIIKDFKEAFKKI
ncbi:MAG: O-acetylhomoserine aminocarboxypropyltransferase/cysteine synthase family protein [Clostridium sp.]|uniref:O-acetylhomoserine aminocarboxypropyltransferase/cysteine synthase family protein n=1 Tax=Clostridium sp. TaxID=1506 RepID=UPI003F40399C